MKFKQFSPKPMAKSLSANKDHIGLSTPEYLLKKYKNCFIEGAKVTGMTTKITLCQEPLVKISRITRDQVIQFEYN
jgi:hypothetical protein